MIRFRAGRYQSLLRPLKTSDSFIKHSNVATARLRLLSASAASSDEEKKPRDDTKSDLKRLLQLYKPEKSSLAVVSAALGISTAITMCVPASMGKVIDIVGTTTAASGATTATALSLPVMTGILGGLFVTGALANVIRIHRTNMMGERIANNLRNSTYKAILSQELGFFDKTRTGELVNRLSADTTLVGTVLSDNAAAGMRSFGQAIGSVSMLFILCPKLALLMCGIVPPVALGAVSYGRKVKSLTANVQKQLGNATSLAEERIGNIRTVRWFNAESNETKLYSQTLASVLNTAEIRSVASSRFFGAVDLSVKSSMLAVLSVGGSMVADGALSVGDLTSFLLYTLYTGFSVAGLSSFYAEMMKGIGASSRIFELINRSPQVASIASSKTIAHDVRGEIKLSDVSFTYDTRPDAVVFKNLSLEIKPNETLALVGPSGCGKSTLAGILARLYETNHGSITIDGINIKEMDPSYLRSLMAAVSQEPPLFAASIADNIAYGSEENNNIISKEEIINAAKAANAHEFITKFKDGYDTSVGERGQALSGGQKQRIAIARALVRNPRILILDEATSALDRESESLVQDAIDKAKVNRTVLLISHRLSTIQGADRIAVLNNGHVVEHGTYDELSASEHSVFSQIVLNSSSSSA